MRIYKDCLEAVKEIERDLFEMGTKVNVGSMQDIKKEFETLEVRTYDYMIAKPLDKMKEAQDYFKLSELEKDYILQEFYDRTTADRRWNLSELNPGKAWRLRPKVWFKFLNRDNKFSYTYAQRIMWQLRDIVNLLKNDKYNRQCIVQIYNNNFDGSNRGGIARIPCSMYYQFIYREGKLNMIYTMRSCDLLTHFIYDMCIAILMLDQVATWTNMKIGDFTHFIGSLHAYKKDMDEKGIF